nr:hypothetical protein [Corynebacterium durum]
MDDTIVACDGSKCYTGRMKRFGFCLFRATQCPALVRLTISFDNFGNSRPVNTERSSNLGIALACAVAFKYFLALLLGSPPMRRAL